MRAELKFAAAQHRPSRYPQLLLGLLQGALGAAPSGAGAGATGADVPGASAGTALSLPAGLGLLSGPTGSLQLAQQQQAPVVNVEAAVDIVSNCPVVLPEVIRVLRE